MSEERYLGTVIWFSKGMGFILPDNQSEFAGKDVFIHFSDINTVGYKNLIKDQRVSFVKALNRKGQLKAGDVQIIQ